MTNLAIEVEGVGKRYMAGEWHRSSHLGMHQMIESVITAPFRKTGRILNEMQGHHIDPREPNQPIWALRNVSFDVKGGEILGLLGHNGAGKSVLLKLISQITRPTEGRVVTRGRVGSMLEAGAAFHPELTGTENIFLSGAILGMSQEEIAKNFDAIVGFAEVGAFLDTPVKRFSSGMKLRLGFAVAAHLESEIMLVDEILAVGDENFKKQSLARMRSVAASGRTVILVSHDMRIVQSLCDRVVLLRNGRVELIGDPDETVNAYLGGAATTALSP